MGSSPALCSFTIGGSRWLTVFDAAAPLERLWRDLDRDCRVLRITPRRRTVRLAGEPGLIVKRFCAGGPIDWLKWMVRGDPAFREWNALRLAADLRLAVPKPLAVGRQRKFVLPRESFLVTEELAGAVTLADCLYGAQRASGTLRRQVVVAAGRLLRRAHDAGMFHKDLHLGNLMIRLGESTPEIFFIDLQRTSFRPRLDLKARLMNLAQLHGGSAEASRAERLRFLRAYFEEGPPLVEDRRAFLSRLEARALKHRHRLWRSRQKRCVADNREFAAVGSGGFTGFARREWSRHLSDLSRPAELLASSTLVKDSRTTTVGAVRFWDRKFHVKRYNYQSLAYALKNLLRPSRARRAWVAANACAMRGISAAAPVVFLERRRRGLLQESYLVCETVDGKMLSEILEQRALGTGDRRALIRALARYLARMHDRRIANRDLKSENLLVTRPQAGRYEFFVVDFDGVRLGPVSRRRRIKNLARLLRESRRGPTFTRTDRLRFLRSYLGPRRHRRWKHYWRAAAMSEEADRE